MFARSAKPDPAVAATRESGDDGCADSCNSEAAHRSFTTSGNRRARSRRTIMINRLAAELVLLFHFVFVALAVFGGFGVLVSPEWAWVF